MTRNSPGRSGSFALQLLLRLNGTRMLQSIIVNANTGEMIMTLEEMKDKAAFECDKFKLTLMFVEDPYRMQTALDDFHRSMEPIVTDTDIMVEEREMLDLGVKVSKILDNHLAPVNDRMLKG